MNYPIERNIPIPPERSAYRTYMTRHNYPWAIMEVTDSFLIPDNGPDFPLVKQSALVAAIQHGRKYGKSFLSRSVDGGVRIWRTR